jgi:hypothetical protein
MKAPDSVARVGGIEFELARFEVIGDCCQVQGRWFGVRGRRFMRPAVTAVVDGRSIRLLADLADKPWTAEDGEPWQATFPYTFEQARLQGAELTVAPDVTITLPAPQRPRGTSRKKSSSQRADPAPPRGLRRAGGGSRVSADEPFDQPDRASRKSRRSELGGGKADALTRELAELREVHRRLRRQLDRLEAEKSRTARRLDEMSRRLRKVNQQREEATAARDRIAAELEAAQRERGEFVAERDAARRERDQMAREREAAQRAHDEVLQKRDVADAAVHRPLSVRWIRWR